MTFLYVSQFYVYLLRVNAYLALCLKCESTRKQIQVESFNQEKVLVVEAISLIVKSSRTFV